MDYVETIEARLGITELNGKIKKREMDMYMKDLAVTLLHGQSPLGTSDETALTKFDWPRELNKSMWATNTNDNRQ